ncbi:hypothetical protein K504DRAFT_470687 [Pleomassaria siparia CBS 279.74]|uniref:Rpr2-domain-containing protein n=1 Tax=Pleomassaria siparia CBS 279.74 TaxID=1314801 RepID=A0A6G1K167_9PLEO|nr:hypothetical protein K504DRAFT_470687 [Pleomassaria siparia CBS 279.74]
MAKVDLLQSRLDFLREAAHLLAIPSPTTSATLGTARDRLFEEHDADLDAPKKEWNALRREVCGACGNLMIPGRTCEVAYHVRSKVIGKKANKDTSKPASTSERPEKDVVYSCLRCNRTTIQPLPPRPSRHAKQLTRANDMGSHMGASNVHAKSTETKAANASSKQRKKTRKGGLQALLDKSKTQTSGSLGLDLMDFMQ